MYFDFEDYRPDIEPVGRAISWRDGLILSIVVHAGLVAFLIFAPLILPARSMPAQPLSLRDQPVQDKTFVFIQPRLDMKAPKPPTRGPNSDQDRTARTVQKAPNPTNSLPFSRGNSPDRVEAQRMEKPRGQGPAPDPAAGQRRQQPAEPQAADNNSIPQLSESPSALQLPAPPRTSQTGANGRTTTAGGSLGDALRNLQRYVQTQNFENATGGTGQFGPEIQFDSKGVEFGPWIRRFIAQVKRNWFIPYAAMSMKGHVVITFNVHKDGSISDLTVVGACPIEAFNNAAFGALASSNPTQPLPPEYPADKAFFTVTFFYNETPP